jgi:Tol biopolymer transport system component
LAIGALGLALLAAAPASAAFPGSNGVIAYERLAPDNESHGIWAVDTVTQHKRRLAGRGAFDPAWSPNGRMIAYRKRGRSQGIFVANANGSNARRVSDQADKHPAFSPSGKRVAFDRQSPGSGFTVISARLDGSNRRRIADGRDPVYSPDGHWIAYLNGGTGRNPVPPTIHVVHPAGSGDRTIFTAGSDDFITDLDWAPDDDQIAFDSFRLGLVTMDPDGSNQQTLGPYGSPLSYSPDGRFIAFPGSFSPGGGTTIATVPVGGGPTTDVAHINAYIDALAWQPLR